MLSLPRSSAITKSPGPRCKDAAEPHQEPLARRRDV